MSKNTVQEPEVVVCDACQLVPITYLSIDVDEPINGWTVFFRERGVEIVLDDIGRLAVRRSVLGELVAEEREREARLAAQRAEQATARKAPVPAGVPAQPDASPFESLQLAPGYTTVAQEFGGGRVSPQREFLDERLAEGQRQAAAARAEAEMLERAQRMLDGRDK